MEFQLLYMVQEGPTPSRGRTLAAAHRVAYNYAASPGGAGIRLTVRILVTRVVIYTQQQTSEEALCAICANCASKSLVPHRSNRSEPSQAPPVDSLPGVPDRIRCRLMVPEPC